MVGGDDESLMVRGAIHYLKGGYGVKFKIHYRHGIFTALFPHAEILPFSRD